MTNISSIIVEFNIGSSLCREIPFKDFHVDEQKSKIYWIHCDLSHPEPFHSVSKQLNLPEYLINICLEEDTTQRVLDDGEALTLQIPGITNEKIEEDTEVNYSNLIIYLTNKFCLTTSQEHQPALKQFRDNYHKNVKYAQTPGFILFLTLDNIINDYADALQEFEAIGETIENRIRSEHAGEYSDVLGIKNQIMKIKRNAVYLRDVLMRISGRKIAVISEEGRLSLCNLFDHTQMVVNGIDSVRDILNSTLDLIDNVLMQRMNEKMKVLTAFAAVFLPLSVISGIYGMNFQWMPELHWHYGYFYALFLMLVCAVGLLWLFKRMRWI